MSPRGVARLAAAGLALIAHNSLAQYGGSLEAERLLLELERRQLETERRSLETERRSREALRELEESSRRLESLTPSVRPRPFEPWSPRRDEFFDNSPRYTTNCSRMDQDIVCETRQQRW
jgi:uncharacterized membrane protein YccC